MNMIGLLLGAMVAMGVLASGCQPATPEQVKRARNTLGIKSDLPKIQTTESSLVGVWQSECFRDLNKDEYFKKDEITFNRNFIDYSTDYFFDSKCKEKAFHQTVSGFYELETSTASVTYETLMVRPQAPIIAASFNQFDGFCKQKDWLFDQVRFFNKLEECGYTTKAKFILERYGANELFLGELKFLLNKKTTELQ